MPHADQHAKPSSADRPWLWRKGQSGNPAGRPKGARNRATLLLEELLSAEEVTQLVKQLHARALAGSWPALRFLLSRLLPPARHNRVAFELPEETGRPEQDAAAALSALVRAVAVGEIAPAEAKLLAGFVERARRLSTGTAPAEKRPAVKSAAKPLPAEAASVFSSVLASPPAATPRRRDTLLGGASSLTPALLESARVPAIKERLRAAA